MSSIPPESAAVSRVLIVDDQPLVRGGFRMLVDSQPDLAVIGEAGDGREAVDLVAGAVDTERIPDVVLMDVRMPQLNGIEATRAILAARPQIKVIVLTTFDLDEYALDGIRAGASGFLLKDARPEELLEAIRTVARVKITGGGGQFSWTAEQQPTPAPTTAPIGPPTAPIEAPAAAPPPARRSRPPSRRSS